MKNFIFSCLVFGIFLCTITEIPAGVLVSSEVQEEAEVANDAQSEPVIEKQQIYEPPQEVSEELKALRKERRQLQNQTIEAVRVGDMQTAKKLQQRLEELKKQMLPIDPVAKKLAEEELKQQQNSIPLNRSEDSSASESKNDQEED